jgi:hypothetical protein
MIRSSLMATMARLVAGSLRKDQTRRILGCRCLMTRLLLWTYMNYTRNSSPREKHNKTMMEVLRSQVIARYIDVFFQCRSIFATV